MIHGHITGQLSSQVLAVFDLWKASNSYFSSYPQVIQFWEWPMNAVRAKLVERENSLRTTNLAREEMEAQI